MSGGVIKEGEWAWRVSALSVETAAALPGLDTAASGFLISGGDKNTFRSCLLSVVVRLGPETPPP